MERKKMITPLMVRRRTQEIITLAAMRMVTKVSRIRSLRKVPKSQRIKRVTRNLEKILSRSPGKLRKSTPQ